ncbi:hypothetical protein [Massilia aquatica]|uniref:hypothetical protein n=1 Tax=Massilia aquatica TaxID=2609000 RepID=UPI001421FDB5|nr:hypothetical protein [Massilia aquatica]
MNLPITTENGLGTESKTILAVEELPAEKDLLPGKRRAGTQASGGLERHFRSMG